MKESKDRNGYDQKKSTMHKRVRVKQFCRLHVVEKYIQRMILEIIQVVLQVGKF